MNEKAILDTPYRLSITDDAKSLCIFLPSARTHHTYPYFPRLDWQKKFPSNIGTLFLADPFQEAPYAEKFGASWFIGPQGFSLLPSIAAQLEQFISHKPEINKVMFYGSSMGGYAALVLATMIPKTIAIAECPQIWLEKHPGSSHVIDATGATMESNPFLSINDIIVEGVGGSRLNVVCNLLDPHYIAHVLPLISQLEAASACDHSMHFTLYMDQRYGAGHTALRFEDAMTLITHNFERGPSREQ